MNDLSISVFRPHEGAVVDLRSLEALADASSRVLEVGLQARVPGATGQILDGLELKGVQTNTGPPGTVRPDPESPVAVLTPGTAIISHGDGRMVPLHIPQALQVPWPDASGPRVRGVLVLWAENVAAGTEDGIAVARDDLHVRVGFVRLEHAEPSSRLLPIASAVGNGQDWATDLGRLLQPEHAAIQNLIGRLGRLEQSVWKADPEGSVWERQVLGRSWVRYQTVAASSLQAARLTLSVRATTTLERVRLMSTLKLQLEASVERVATELLQIVGPAEGAGPYRSVIGGKR